MQRLLAARAQRVLCGTWLHPAALVQAARPAQDPSTGEWAYEGWQDTIKHVTDLCASHGPFDGLWAFSQV
jgi:hypothetical protein